MDICALVSGGKTNDCAAWIQAVGSVVAIFASGAIAGWQIRAANRAARHAQRDRKRAMAEAAAALAHQFFLQIGVLQKELNQSAFYIPGVQRSKYFNPISSLEASVLSLPLHEMPDLESMRLLIGFRNLIGVADTAFKRLTSMLEDPVKAKKVKAADMNFLVLAAEENDKKWTQMVERLH